MDPVWNHLLLSWYQDRWSFFGWTQNQSLTLFLDIPTRHVPLALCYPNMDRQAWWICFKAMVAFFPFTQKEKNVWQETNQGLKDNEILSQALKNPSIDIARVPYGSDFDCTVVQGSWPLGPQIFQVGSLQWALLSPRPLGDAPRCLPPQVTCVSPFHQDSVLSPSHFLAVAVRGENM